MTTETVFPFGRVVNETIPSAGENSRSVMDCALRIATDWLSAQPDRSAAENIATAADAFLMRKRDFWGCTGLIAVSRAADEIAEMTRRFNGTKGPESTIDAIRPPVNALSAAAGMRIS